MLFKKTEEANEDRFHKPIFQCSYLAWNNLIKPQVRVAIMEVKYTRQVSSNLIQLILLSEYSKKKNF